MPGAIDVAVFAIPAKLVARRPDRVRREENSRRGADPVGLCRSGNAPELQDEIVAIGKNYDVRLMGPNIYGFYDTPVNLCATFCTAFGQGLGGAVLESGGIGMAIIGFSRSAKMGVSAIVGLGNKSDIDEDDLLAFFEQDPNTTIIAQHCEDLKDGRAFAEAAGRVSKKKPVVVLKAGRTLAGARRLARIPARSPATTRSTRTC